jgi:outer membrane protein assembly factor BamB
VPPPPPTGRPPTGLGWIVAGIVAAVVVVFGVVGLIVAAADRSPQLDPGRRGESVAGGWTHAGPAGTGTNGLVTDGRAVCSTAERELFCLNATSGEQLFSQTLPGPATGPTWAGDMVVVAADGGPGQGDLYGYTTGGELRWDAPIQVEGIEEDIAALRPELPAADGTVAVPTDDGGFTQLVGVDARSGRELWRAYGSGGSLDSSESWTSMSGRMVSDGHRFYAMVLVHPSFDDIAAGQVPAEPPVALVALDAGTGAELWRTEPLGSLSDPTFVAGAALLSDESAVAVAIDGEPARVLVLDVATGDPRWDLTLEGDRARVAHVDGVTIVTDRTAMRGYDDGGAELWDEAAPGGEASSPSLPPDLVVEGGELYALRLGVFRVDPADGARQRLVRDASARDAVVAGDHLVVSRLDQGILAVPLPG